MENASKALIIAGAILLAIVIISLGLIVVNNSRSVTDNTNLNAQEIEAFNNKFMAYEGQNKTAAQIKTLKQVVIASNAENTTHTVTINSADANNYDTSSLKSSDRKTVTLTYVNGYVSNITIN